MGSKGKKGRVFYRDAFGRFVKSPAKLWELAATAEMLERSAPTRGAGCQTLRGRELEFSGLYNWMPYLLLVPFLLALVCH